MTPDADGSTFTGSISGALGAMPISGTVEGETLPWTMKMPVPMPIEVECKATVAGDTLEGTVKAGFMGTDPLTGSRKA